MTDIYLTNKQAKEVLRVSSHRVWRSHLEAVGLHSHEEILEWDALEALYALQLYLSVGTGQHSKADFAQVYKSEGLSPLKDTIRCHGIDYDYAVQMFAQTILRYQNQNLETELVEISQSEDQSQCEH